ncbi:TorF family putative porin [Variovorax soli]|uniref:TorF family putative porin n=1 Tax=Variovorax soli TaxID=376815 RepID=UPI000837AEF2
MHMQLTRLGTVGAILLAPALASAQAAGPSEASPITANVTLTTNYKFRGQDQDVLGSNGNFKTSAVKPALQGGFDYAHESGFYIGNWNSSVNWMDGNSIEMDVYGGYKFKAGGLDWDVGTLGYIYPGATQGNTWEIYGSGSYASAFGAFTLKYSHTVSDDYFNWAGAKAGSGLSGRNTGYLNLGYAYEVVPKLTLKAAVGYTFFASDIKDNTVAQNYYDYNVGASYDFGGGLSLGGYVQGANKGSAFEVTGADGKTRSPNKARFIVALTKTL